MVFGFKLWSKTLIKRKMNDSPRVKKLVQITEEAQKPVHIPIVFGNECFVVTQQDIRKIEDTRLLTYSKLTPNGELIPMESLGHNANVSEAILNACKYRMQLDQNAATADVNILLELLTRICSKQPQNMEISNIDNTQQQSPASCVATLEQQLQWAKANNNSSEPFPFTLNSATSTANITTNKAITTQQTSNDCCCCCSNKCKTDSCSRGSNTMETDESSRKSHSKDPPQSAREQLKQKKISQDISYVP